jgi:hypothetical protein
VPKLNSQLEQGLSPYLCPSLPPRVVSRRGLDIRLELNISFIVPVGNTPYNEVVVDILPFASSWVRLESFFVLLSVLR